MKKVLLLSVCLIVSCLLGGGKSWAAVTFTENGTTLTINVTGTATDDDASSVSSKMSNSNYTKVVVVGGTINDNFAQNIFYTSNGGWNINTVITSLDFSQTSYNSTTFGESVFHDDYSWRKTSLKITSLSLPGNITKIGDEAFMNMSSLTEVVLPENLTYIGKKAFAGTSLTSITFPANLDKIDDAAFFNVKIKDLKFNSKLRYIGNSAFAWDNVNEANGEKVLGAIIIPASVKYIGPAAFFNHQYQDVYFQGGVAPVMPYGGPVVNIKIGNVVECTAFSAHTLMSNNGFDPSSTTTTGGTSDNTDTGYANRENYINGGAYMAILHYPNTVTNTDSLKTFTDITRKYEADTAEVFNKNHNYAVGKEKTPLTAFGVKTSEKVNVGYKDTYLGEQFIWPSQNQWMRSYITAVNGVEWDGVTSYRSTLQDWEKAVLAEAGYTTDKYTEDELSKMAHQGTRMFVLANNDAQSEKYNPGNIKKDGTWWTICVPFNMTKKQVLDTFGSKTQLCLFRSVTREIEINGKNHILIRFDIDPMKYKTADANGKKLKYDGTDGTHAAGEWKYDEIASDDVVSDNVDDNDIAIWAHESYMIKPSDGEKSDQDPVVTIANYEPVPGNPLPSVVRAETVYKTQDEPTYNNLYRFVGNYESGMTMPQYSYFYGTTKNDKTEKFRFNTGTTTVWKANKSLIQASAHDGGFQDFQNFFGGSAESAAKVKQTTVFGGIDDPNGDTTAIDDVQIVVGNDTLTPIFSLDGKMVSVNGDTTGLAKGIYVKAGKKFIVE